MLVPLFLWPSNKVDLAREYSGADGISDIE